MCLAIEADLSEEQSYDKIIQETFSRFGQIDVLINNAGLANSASIVETELETWDKIHAVNARAPFFLSKAAIPFLRKSSKPFIVNIGSVVGFKGYVDQAAYASSKHALTGFTKVLAKEVQHYGIQVHLVSPGGVNTEMVQEMRPDIDFEQLIQPEEIAEIVEFIVTRKGRGTIDHFYIRRQGGMAFD
jgi:3-oxoacyl-[acyl-carrier protein] reductase